MADYGAYDIGAGAAWDEAREEIDSLKAEITRLREALKGATVITNTASGEIKRLRALLREVRGDISDFGFSDSFADETHKTLAKIDIGLGDDEQHGNGETK